MEATSPRRGTCWDRPLGSPATCHPHPGPAGPSARGQEVPRPLPRPALLSCKPGSAGLQPASVTATRIELGASKAVFPSLFLPCKHTAEIAACRLEAVIAGGGIRRGSCPGGPRCVGAAGGTKLALNSSLWAPTAGAGQPASPGQEGGGCWDGWGPAAAQLAGSLTSEPRSPAALHTWSPPAGPPEAWQHLWGWNEGGSAVLAQPGSFRVLSPPRTPGAPGRRRAVTLPRATRTGGCQAGARASKATAPAQPVLVCSSVELAGPACRPPLAGGGQEPWLTQIQLCRSQAVWPLPAPSSRPHWSPGTQLASPSHSQEDPAAQSLTAGSKGATGWEGGLQEAGALSGSRAGGGRW